MMIYTWDNIVVKHAHLYGSQCNPLLHSAPTHYGHSGPLFLGAPLSPDPLKDCPARCHLRWLRRCLLGAQILKKNTVKSLDIYKAYRQIIIRAYRELRQRTWQHHGVHGNRAELVPLNSRGWSCLCSSRSHRLRIRESLRWLTSATPYWLSGEKDAKMHYCPGKASIFFKDSTYMRWLWYTQTHPLAIDGINHNEKRHAKQKKDSNSSLFKWEKQSQH